MTATFLACLTPPGTAAIATFALRGPAAWTLVRSLAQRDLPLEPEAGRFWLTGLGDASRGEVDEVVVIVKRAGPEPWLELHCHGGREVLRLLEELFVVRGAEVCSWQQLERITSDSLQAIALEALTGALTTRTAAIALDQFNGAFARAVQAIQNALQGGDLASADLHLGELERNAPVGRHLTTPWRVVIAGAANVGKSSLVNALAGYQRSLVSATPGTTRDVVTTLLAVDGWPIEVADTAGWRATDLTVEQEGLARARAVLAGADLTLWMVDAGSPPVWPDVNLETVRYVVNKVDLPQTWPVLEIQGSHVSALTGAGVPELCQALASLLVPSVPPPGAAVPFTDALAQAVTDARRLVQGDNGRGALEMLREVCGECG
jgi:tRNA modification GTPase